MKVGPAPPEHYRWIAERAHLVIGDTFSAIEAVDKKGLIAGMVGYDGWTPNSCCLHIALDRPIALRALVCEGFATVWRTGRTVALASVLGTNERSLNLVRHLGFREKTRIHDGWMKGVDLVLFEMRRETCRWAR